MTIYRILKYPHVLLRKKSTPVEKFTEDLSHFVENMVKTMYAFDGIGLAAPQVGILKRIIVVDVLPFLENESLKEWKGETLFKVNGVEKPLEFPLKLINPTIVSHGPLCPFPFDGCLSFPGLPRGTTQRFSQIVLESRDPQGQLITIETTGILNICLQHELDHLEGVLFIDRLGRKIEDKMILEEIASHDEDLGEKRRLKKLKPTDAQQQKFQFI